MSSLWCKRTFNLGLIFFLPFISNLTCSCTFLAYVFFSIFFFFLVHFQEVECFFYQNDIIRLTMYTKVFLKHITILPSLVYIFFFGCCRSFFHFLFYFRSHYQFKLNFKVVKTQKKKSMKMLRFF